MREENLTETVIIPEGTKRIEPHQFDLYVKLHEITIPDSVKVIGKYAFSHCRELREIHIPPYVKNFYEGIFFNCHALEKVNIPDSVKYIGNMAFCNCHALKEIHIPDSVEALGNEVFIHCEALTEVTIPDSVEKFGKGIFWGCKNLRAVHYRGVTIRLNLLNNQSSKMLKLIQSTDFSLSMDLPMKYHTAGRMYLAGVAPEQTKAYIKAKFPAVFRGLIDLEETEAIEKIVTSGEFVSRRNIDKYIDYAIDKGKTEISIILMNYKNEKIGYRAPEELFRL